MKYFIFFFLLLMPFFTIAQEKKDQKIGLVLSGGGAKGLAHIGALKVIEEAGIKLDYIGGTSMGAIVGALYASGYTATQLDSIFQEVNFNVLIQDEIPRSAKTFYEKDDSERYALSLPFDNFGISFPSGLSKGQNIYNLISRLTMHLGEVRDFSKLPIPFFCVASNIETGEQVILDSGSLAKAVSASGAIPSLFTPVKIDGMLLTDGGVTNNYPVDELRNRGAEIIIGVDVQDTLLDREGLTSAFQILNQIGNFRTIREMDEKAEKTDIYIKPDISGFNLLSFERGDKIIHAGEEAAREQFDKLKTIASQQSASRQIKKVEPLDTLNINAVIIEGNSSYPRSYILGKLRLKYNSHYTMRELSKGINTLTATANFDRISYNLTPNNGAYDLSLQLEESRNKTFLKLALHYDDLYKSGALVNLTRKSFLVTNDVASLDIILGDNSRYNFNYFIDKGYYWSFGVKSRYNHFDKGVSLDAISFNPQLEDVRINKIELDYQDYTNQIYAETLFRQIFSFGVGVEHKYLKITSETIGSTEEDMNIPSTIFEKSHFYSTFGYLKLDSYDNKYFPSKGVYFEGNFHLYLFSSDYNQNFSEYSIAKGKVGYAFSLLNKFSTRISSEAGFRIGSDGNHSLDFFLGGYGNNLINNLVPFYGYDFLSISSDSFIKGLIEFDYEIFRNNHIILSGNFANLENDLYTSGNWFSAPDYTGYALGYGLETFLGPMEVKYSYSPEIKNSEWYFSLGFWF